MICRTAPASGRWLEGEARATASGAYYPFGVGSRKCLGESLAWIEGSLVLSAIARRWRLRTVGESPVTPRAEITLSPNGRRWMRVEERTLGPE